MKRVRMVVGIALLAVASFLAVHATVHPNAHHPAWWLVATVFGIGLALLAPEIAKTLLDRAVDFLPWRKS